MVEEFILSNSPRDLRADFFEFTSADVPPEVESAISHRSTLESLSAKSIIYLFRKGQNVPGEAVTWN